MKTAPRTDDGDAGASVRGAITFDDLYARYFPFVWRCLQGLGVSVAALDDAAQDVFVVVHRRLLTFRGQSTARTWLFGIVRNVASSYRRRARRKPTEPEQLDREPAHSSGGPLERAQDAEAAALLQSFLSSVPERKRMSSSSR